MGETVANSSLYPYLRLYGPDGMLLDSNLGSAAAGVSTRATNSGTFTVVAGNYEFSSPGGNGTYRITLAITTVGSAVVVAPGDEGGAMTGAGFYNGTIDIGDLDVWRFTAHAGDSIVLQMAKTVSGNSFYPYLRLYGPDGALLNSDLGSAAAGVSRRATNSGPFTVVAGNYEFSSPGGNGTYRLTVNGLSDGLKVCVPVISGTNFTIGGVGGPSGTNFVLYTTTNIAPQVVLWSPILTNQFNQFGVFDYTNIFNPAEHQRYFRFSHQ